MGKTDTLTGVVADKETRLVIVYDGNGNLQMRGQFHVQSSSGVTVTPEVFSGAAPADLTTAFMAAVQAAITAAGF